jgi:hypothetical protein
LFLAAYLATNVAFCVIDISFSDSFEDVASSVRNRSGALAVVNMVPLFVLAGRNNPLIPLLGISFDTYNLMHRWFGRIVALEAITHTLAHWAKGGWGPAIERTFQSESFLWGFIVSHSSLIPRYRLLPMNFSDNHFLRQPSVSSPSASRLGAR